MGVQNRGALPSTSHELAEFGQIAGGGGSSTPDGNPTPSLHGFLGWSIDPAAATAYCSPSAQKMYLNRVPWSTTRTVTNIIGVVLTAGSSLVNCLIGIYDASGNLLAACPDQATSWNSGGVKTMALTTPTSIPGTNGYVYVAYIINSGTFSNLWPAAGLGATTTNMGLPANTYRSANNYLGPKTSLPATIDLTGWTLFPYVTPFGLS